MSDIGWIIPAFLKRGFQAPAEFRAMVQRGEHDQLPIHFLSREIAVMNTDRMVKLFPAHDVLAFAMRCDYDGVICLVLSDGAFPRGHVLVLHWDGCPGTEIDDEFPSLTAWAAAADAEVAEWSKPLPETNQNGPD